MSDIWDTLTPTQQGVIKTVFEVAGIPISGNSVDWNLPKAKLSEKAFSVATDRVLSSVAADCADIIATIDNYSIGGNADKTKQLLSDFRQKVTMLRIETTWNYNGNIPATYWMELNALFSLLPQLSNDLGACRIYDFAKDGTLLCGLIDWTLFNVSKAFELIKKYKDKIIIGYGEH